MEVSEAHMAKKKYVRAGKSTPHWGSREVEIVREHGATLPIEKLKKLLPGRTENAIRWMRTKLKITYSAQTRHEIATKTAKTVQNKRAQAQFVENSDGYEKPRSACGRWNGPEMRELLNLVPVTHPNLWYKYLPGKTFRDIDEHFKLHEITVKADVRAALDEILATPRADFITSLPWESSNG